MLPDDADLEPLVPVAGGAVALGPPRRGHRRAARSRRDGGGARPRRAAGRGGRGTRRQGALALRGQRPALRGRRRRGGRPGRRQGRRRRCATTAITTCCPSVMDSRTPVAETPESATDGDSPLLANVWSIAWINADDVWALGYHGDGIVVGHIDSGVWLTHPDIANRLWTNPGEIAGQRSRRRQQRLRRRRPRLGLRRSRRQSQRRLRQRRPRHAHCRHGRRRRHRRHPPPAWRRARRSWPARSSTAPVRHAWASIWQSLAVHPGERRPPDHHVAGRARRRLDLSRCARSARRARLRTAGVTSSTRRATTAALRAADRVRADGARAGPLEHRRHALLLDRRGDHRRRDRLPERRRPTLLGARAREVGPRRAVERLAVQPRRRPAEARPGRPRRSS